MTFQVTVTPSGRQFECGNDETLLAAALRAGVGIPYGCKNGACGSCKGRVVSGEVVHSKYQEKALTAAETEQGMSLFCCAKPQSDLTIEAREIATGAFAVKKLPTRIAKLEKLSDDVMLVTLQLPATENLDIPPVSISIFCYAMANAAATVWQTHRIPVNKLACTFAICRAACLPIRYFQH